MTKRFFPALAGHLAIAEDWNPTNPNVKRPFSIVMWVTKNSRIDDGIRIEKRDIGHESFLKASAVG